MLRRCLASSIIIAIFLIAGLAAACAAPRALLELFTSQGCSSCPPADKLLGEFADDTSVVAVSLPIDIWDYLGWKDTLALPGHSARQRAYAHVRGDRQVYTPQMVVNGVVDALGSDRAAIKDAIAQTDRNAAVMSLPVLVAVSGGDVRVMVKAASGGQAAGEVWLCPLASTVAVTIGRGENRGRTVTYRNVVRAWRKLGDFSGADSAWSIPLSEIEDDKIDAAVVMVQEGTHDKPGIVLGAALTSLGPLPTENRRQATDNGPHAADER